MLIHTIMINDGANDIDIVIIIHPHPPGRQLGIDS